MEAQIPLESAGPNPKRWWILALCGLGQLMVVLDLTVVNIALPEAQTSLKFTNDDRQWVVTAYALAFGSLLLLGGKLADRFGRKRTFIIGMAGFAAASALGGAATSFGMLAGARALQGVFAALLAPSTLSLLTTTFSNPAERGKAFGIYGAIAGGGSAVGLLLGGALTTYLSWRWCLYVNDVFAVLGLIGASVLLDRSVRNDEVHIDDPGIVLAVAGLVALVFGFSEAATDGWGAAITLIPLIVSPLLLVAFVLVERRAAHPILPLPILFNRNRGASYLTILLVAIGMFGVFLFLTYYLEVITHYSAVKTGIVYLPMTACLVLASIMTNTRLLPRFGPRVLVPGAGVAAALALVYLAQLKVGTSFGGGILPSLLLFGLGAGVVFGCCINMATAGASPETAGVASALVTTGQQVGGSIGTSLLNTLAASAATTYLTAHATKAFLATHTATTILVTPVGRQSQVHSYDFAFYISAGVLLVAAIAAFLIYPSGRPAPVPAGEPALAGV